MVAEINTGHNPFNKRSVLIIDEASTLSNRDHASLVRRRLSSRGGDANYRRPGT